MKNKKERKKYMLPKRVYFSTVVARWSMAESDVIAFFMGRGMLFAMLENVKREIFFHDHIWERIKELAQEKGAEVPYPKPENESFVRIPVLEEYLETIQKNGYWEGPVIIQDFKGDEREEIFESAIVYNQEKRENIRISKKDLYVSSTDLLAIEKELKISVYGESTTLGEDIPFMDTNHNFHPKELKIAVEAWLELYEKNPPNGKPKGGHKKYIEEWLSRNHPDLGVNALGRIKTIINPNPKGGASPSGME